MTKIQWSAYPDGTKAYATCGGHWVKVRRGWKWCTGTAIFPRPGADYFRIELPFMTQIQWTKCSERMPPDGYADILLKQGTKFMRTHGVIAAVNKDFLIGAGIEWTPYNPEAWAELNKK